MGFSFYMSTYDSLIIKLIAGEQIVVSVPSKVELNQLRVASYKKLQAHIKQWDDLGYLSDSLRDSTVSTVVDKLEDGSLLVTLKLVKRRKPFNFTILSSSDQGTPDHAEISTHLEHDQDCEIQQRSPDHDSQGHGTDVDSSSTQGESNGQCFPAEDWESELRKFIESDSGTQDET